MDFSRRSFVASLLFAAPLASACTSDSRDAFEGMSKLPAPALAAKSSATPGAREKAVLAGGCFWGVQAVFAHVSGVSRSVSGYAGGTPDSATYEKVSTGQTNHAEAVEVTFDPSVVSYGEILQIFFSVGTDPTQLDMQFPDVGPQYRNEIFYTTPEQEKIARAYIAELQAAGAFGGKPIVTRISPLQAFYRAEDYHQDYFFEHPNEPYIAMYDRPKVAALRVLFPDRFRARPVRFNRA